jgi:AcrR family transcriptional regulator
VFADKGYDRASVRAIAADAAVDPALMYHYFGSQKELFIAVMNVSMSTEWTAQLIAAIGPTVHHYLVDDPMPLDRDWP